jgi:hypothetical protein
MISEKSLKLLTFVTFQQPKCREWNAINLNQYLEKKRKWKSHEFFSKKFNDFNGCELVIEVADPQVPCYAFDYDVKTDIWYNVWGYGHKMTKVISKSLNFTFHYNPFDLLLNLTYNASLEHSDLYLRALSTRRKLMFHEDSLISRPFSVVEELVLLSRPEIYTPFKKLFLPFDWDVWIWLIITMAVAIITIYIIKFTTKKIQNFVFGNGISSPVLNFV